MSTYNYKSGLGNSAAYQVSGAPYVNGPKDNAPEPGGPFKITFPKVTRWITIYNYGTAGANPSEELLCGFSANGLSNQTNAFSVLATDQLHLEVKVTELYYTGSCPNFTVIAGLTSIDNTAINNPSVSPSGSNTNWSGSLSAQVG
tara:strand:+ start:224 stop:658 length:435 start_codon:yes stop_codon:yes gene_type:complete